MKIHKVRPDGNGAGAARPARPVAPMPPSTQTAQANNEPEAAVVDETPAAAATDKTENTVKEIGGPKGPEPTRYGDWERKGRCVDF